MTDEMEVGEKQPETAVVRLVDSHCHIDMAQRCVPPSYKEPLQTEPGRFDAGLTGRRPWISLPASGGKASWACGMSSPYEESRD